MKDFVVQSFGAMLNLLIIVATIAGFVVGLAIGVQLGGLMALVLAVVFGAIGFFGGVIVSGTGLMLVRITEQLDEHLRLMRQGVQPAAQTARRGESSYAATLPQPMAPSQQAHPPAYGPVMYDQPAQTARPAATRPTIAQVSSDERELLTLQASQMTIAEMASKMNTTEEWVLKTLADLRSRFGAYNNTMLVERAHSLGILPPTQ